MSEFHNLRSLIVTTLKGITPDYISHSNIIVLNQKCIRNNQIDYGFAQFHNPNKKFSSEKIIKPGDILINSTGQGTAGRCAFVKDLPKDHTVIVDSHILIVRVGDFYTAGCLEYSLYSIEPLLQTFMDGSTGQGEFDKQRLYNIITALPMKDNRKDVYDLLNNIDVKIELNNRINAELEAMAKTLYDYWFVQFDFPDANGNPYKTSGGKMVYNPTLKREIPDGWDVGALGQYLSFKRGISYTSQDIQNAGIPLINLNSFTLAGKFKYEGTKYFNGKYRAENLLSAGELVIAITDVTRNADIIGKAFVIPDIFQTKPLMSCDVASVSSARFGNSYLEQLFNSTHYHEYIKHFASGTLVLHLDLNGVKWFKSFIPPVELLAHYEATCEQLLKQRDIVIKENLLLEQLRDWLLPMLMNGQVTVNS